jgi:dolichol kinase
VVACAGAVAATLAEISRLPVDDNVEVPIVSALAMSLAQVFF